MKCELYIACYVTVPMQILKYDKHKNWNKIGYIFQLKCVIYNNKNEDMNRPIQKSEQNYWKFRSLIPFLRNKFS